MPTIKDVARLSGYSVSTCSYALSGNKKIPPETAEKIKETADKIGYKPNAFARGLKNKRIKNIGVFLTGFRGPVHPTILDGLSESIKLGGDEYKMIVTISRCGYDMIYQGLVDLAFVMSPLITDEEIEKISLICPVIIFDKVYNGKNIYNTYFKNKEAIYERVMDFNKKGCKRFAFLSGSAKSRHNMERLEGFKQAIEELKIKEEDYTIIDGIGYTEKHGYQYLGEYIDKVGTFDFDALVCSNDELAIGSMKLLDERGYKIPEQIRISGFDNIEKGQYVNPKLSTSSVDWFKYGMDVGALALKILNNERGRKDLVVNAELINRISG